MPDFQTVYNLHQQDGFVVLAVNNRESEEDVQKFVDQLGLKFTVVLDQSGAIRDDLYGSAIPGFPTSFLIDQNGVIVRIFPSKMTGTELLDALDPLLNS
jgi:peroxiredoxin